MDEAKELITHNLGREINYIEIWKIMDEKWVLQLYRHLYIVRYFFNPQFQYNEIKSTNPEVKLEVYHYIDRLIVDSIERATVDMQFIF